MVQLGKIYNRLRDGMSTAPEWFEADAAPEAEHPEPVAGVEGAKAALRRRVAEKPIASADAEPPK